MTKFLSIEEKTRKNNKLSFWTLNKIKTTENLSTIYFETQVYVNW
jgi:hypothetical protein